MSASHRSAPGGDEVRSQGPEGWRLKSPVSNDSMNERAAGGDDEGRTAPFPGLTTGPAGSASA